MLIIGSVFGFKYADVDYIQHYQIRSKFFKPQTTDQTTDIMNTNG